MLCLRCAALPPELRLHPSPAAVAVPPGREALRALVCERCGAATRGPEAGESLPDALARLERAGLGVSALLRSARPRAA